MILPRPELADPFEELEGRHRQSFQFPEASNLVDDLQERRHMAEAVKNRYAQTH